MEPCRSRPPAWAPLQALWAALILVCLLLQLSPLVNRVTEDESLLIYDSARVAQGQVPYRDFFSLWVPGGFYAFSGGPWGWWGRPETGTRYLQVVVVLLLHDPPHESPAPLGRVGVAGGRPAPHGALPHGPFHGQPLVCRSGLLGGHHRGRLDLEDSPGRLGVARHGIPRGNRRLPDADRGRARARARPPRRALGRGVGKSVTGDLLRTLGGGVLAVGLWLGPLALQGGAPGFIRDAVLWPLTNYRKPGNVADLPFLADLPARFAGLWGRGWEGPGRSGCGRGGHRDRRLHVRRGRGRGVRSDFRREPSGDSPPEGVRSAPEDLPPPSSPS